jgi:D-glycero-D-manno-heptose 1,7-bisphosphate phosphatase
MARLILLDRDGVINFDSPDFIKRPDEWRPIPGALDAVASLKRRGYLVGVCTNQSGVGRGLFSEAMLADIHQRLHTALAERGVALDAIAYCPHGPDAGCVCRKPRPGLLRRTMTALRVCPERTLFVGDSLRDVRAARAAGVKSVFVTGSGKPGAARHARMLGTTAVVDDLATLARSLNGGKRC